MEPNNRGDLVRRLAQEITENANDRENWEYVRVVMVTSDKKMTALADATNLPCAPNKAKLVLVGCALPNHPATNWNDTDIPQGLEFCVHQVDSKCVGVFVYGTFDDSKVRQVLEIPDDVRVWAIVPVSHSEKILGAETREETVYHNSWDTPLYS